MVLTAAHLVNFKSFKADDSAGCCHVRRDHISETSSSLSSPVDQSDLHLIELSFEAELAQVIDTTPV